MPVKPRLSLEERRDESLAYIDSHPLNARWKLIKTLPCRLVEPIARIWVAFVRTTKLLISCGRNSQVRSDTFLSYKKIVSAPLVAFLHLSGVIAPKVYIHGQYKVLTNGW